MRRPSALLLSLLTLGCTDWSPARPGPNLSFPACFLLTYAEWGDPPRSDGQSMQGAKAPVVMMLEDVHQDSVVWPGADSSDRVARWSLGATDTVSYLGSWERRGEDSISVLFAFPPILFGQRAAFQIWGEHLSGTISTFSDVVGAKQGGSQVAGLRIPCQMPRLELPPRYEDEEEDSVPGRPQQAGPQRTQ